MRKNTSDEALAYTDLIKFNFGPLGRFLRPRMGQDRARVRQTHNLKIGDESWLFGIG